MTMNTVPDVKNPKFFKNKFHFVIHHIRVHGSNIVEKLAVFLQRP